jgi:putative phosphoribosyl transferase
MNDAAAREIAGPVELTIVPDAGHLFEEPGAIERVAALAQQWFRDHLASV